MGMKMLDKNNRKKHVFSLKIIKPPKFDFIKVDRFNDALGAFALDACEDYGIIERRDKHYLNWKFVDNPVRDYSIYTAKSGGALRGYVVLRERDLTGFIVDILTRSNDKSAMKFLIKNVIKYFEKLNVKYIVCLATDRNLKNTLMKSGFLPNILTGKADDFMIHINNDELDEKFFSHLDNWYLTTALSDRE